MPLPTPDTTNSVISDEDVARQLMRLGEPSNFSTYSTHGRTSTSTMDDALSRNAQISSDDEDSEAETDREHDLPPLPYSNHVDGALHRKYETAESSGDDYEDTSFKGESDQMPNARLNHTRVKPTKPRATSLPKTDKSSKPRAAPKSKAKASSITATSKLPMSPASIPPQSRKASVSSHQHNLAPDEEDLSAKPRCQRCRKSKKGCDRMRPCGRCKDAGIGIEGCISEDEAAGRKGRYGRHMGIPVKKQEMGPPAAQAQAQANGFEIGYHPDAGQMGYGVTLAAVAAADKNGKKRKR